MPAQPCYAATFISHRNNLLWQHRDRYLRHCRAVSQKMACASPGSAKSLATRRKNDPQFLKRWLGFKPTEQLPLPLESGSKS